MGVDEEVAMAVVAWWGTEDTGHGINTERTSPHHRGREEGNTTAKKTRLILANQERQRTVLDLNEGGGLVRIVSRQRMM